MFKIFVLLIVLALVGNLLFIDYVISNQANDNAKLRNQVASLSERLDRLSDTSVEIPLESTPSAVTVAGQSCSVECQLAINAAVAKIKIPISQNSVVKTPTKTSATKGEYVIPLGSGSPTKIGEWEDVWSAQGIVDTVNYSNIKAIYFEVLMHTAEGELKAKLYDDTTPFSYDGQVLSTNSNTSTLLTATVPLVSGRKNYHVKLFSTITTNSALDSARIRIVTGN